MTVYVVLFRGVGGATQLPVKPLRETLTAAGFENVTTYINSGNAVVRSALPRQAVIEKIAAVCAEEFGFTKAIYAPTRDEWRELVASNPFAGSSELGKSLHAAILEETPYANRVAALKALCEGRDGLEVVGDVAYIYTPDGFGLSKLAALFDKRIGVPNTARNWNTVMKLMELADAAEQ